MHKKMAVEFKRSGFTVALDGREDCLLDSNLKPFWEDPRICGGKTMPQWREAYVQQTKEAKEKVDFKTCTRGPPTSRRSPASCELTCR